MGMITNKKLIAVLLIPIMLIVFATPCFALDTLLPSSSGMDFSAVAQKVLQIAMKVGVYSLQVGVQFAGEFMNIHNINDVIRMGTSLFNTGIGLATPLINILTQINIQDPASILPVLTQLLELGKVALGDFTNIIFGKDLTDPTNLFNFAKDLVEFAIPKIQGLFGVLTNGEDVDLGSLGNLVSDPTGALSGILGSFLGNIEVPRTEPEVPKVPELPKAEPEAPKVEEENTQKPNITDDSSTDNEETEKLYDMGYFKVIMPQDELAEQLGLINKGHITQTWPDYSSYAKDCACEKLATYHINIILGYVENPNLYDCFNNFDEYAKNCATTRAGTLENLRNTINDGDPCLVHVYSKDADGTQHAHWVTCIGYKDKGEKLSDFLFVSAITGQPLYNTTNEVVSLFNYSGTQTDPNGIKVYDLDI